MSFKHVFSALDRERLEIRLLHAYRVRRTAGNPIVGLRGRLERVSLFDAPEYRALSYVWGSSTAVSTVTLDDGSYIPVAANLLDALLHIAAIDLRPSPIWIDAVCIDQANDAEKSWQVQIMDQIYSRAEVTLVYLGPSTRYSDEAFPSFSAHGRSALQHGILDLHNSNDTFEFGYERWTWAPLDSQGGESIDDVIQGIERSETTPPLRLLSSILERPWWSRIWVLQELLLSPNPILVCGHQTMPARVFVASIRLYEAALTVYCERLMSEPHNDSFGQSYLQSIIDVTRSFHDMADVPALVLYTTQLRQVARSRYHGIQEPYFGLGNLWNLVQDVTMSARRLNASDPRDRIYALICIARLSRVDVVDIQPDYALSCEDVYSLATHSFMLYAGSRMLELAAFSHERTLLPNLPSWAVDWSLSGLVLTPEPTIDTRDPSRFGLTRNMSNNYVLTTSVQILGVIETVKIDYPTLEPVPGSKVASPEEEGLDTIACLSKYFSEVNAYVEMRSLASECRQSLLERLTHAMVLYSTSKEIDTRSVNPTFSEIREEASLLQAQILLMSDLEGRCPEDAKCVAAAAITNSWLEIRPVTLSGDPVSDVLDIELGAERFSFVLGRIRETLLSETIPLIANKHLVGIGPRAMDDGDVLIGYEKEGLIFVARPVDGGLYELVGSACVPQLKLEQGKTSPGEASVISLC